MNLPRRPFASARLLVHGLLLFCKHYAHETRERVIRDFLDRTSALLR